MSVTAIYSFEAAPGKADELLALLQQGREFAASVEGFEALTYIKATMIRTGS
jgi:hypothetical protein